MFTIMQKFICADNHVGMGLKAEKEVLVRRDGTIDCGAVVDGKVCGKWAVPFYTTTVRA